MNKKSSFKVIFCFTNILDTTAATGDEVDKIWSVAIDVLENFKSLTE